MFTPGNILNNLLHQFKSIIGEHNSSEARCLAGYEGYKKRIIGPVRHERSVPMLIGFSSIWQDSIVQYIKCGPSYFGYCGEIVFVIKSTLVL